MVVVGGREEMWVVKAFSDVISSTVDMARTVFGLGVRVVEWDGSRCGHDMVESLYNGLFLLKLGP